MSIHTLSHYIIISFLQEKKFLFQISSIFLISTLALHVTGQYDRGYSSGYTSPPVAILMHKQALGQDGSFNYAFSAENGLQQGESINPDGSRTGSYSYVDPNGKTISLRYTAGKDGFRVLEGDHIPKAPLPIPPANNYHQPQINEGYRSSGPSYTGPSYSGPSYNGPSYDGAYRSSGPYEGAYRNSASNYRSPIVNFRKPQYSVDEGSEDRSGFYDSQYRAGPFSSNFDEEPYTGPHTFGNGFSFEFAG